jgi:hypothetical protein
MVPSPPDATHVLPHIRGLSLGHDDAHAVPLQTCPEGHALVQLPQWVASLAMH